MFQQSVSPRTTTMLPSPDSPAEQTRTLINQKSNIEAELESHISILKANNVTMQTRLVDAEGFPRADIDIYAVRGARVRIIELRNDLKAVVDAIGKALEGIYDPAIQRSSQIDSSSERPLKSFAKVDGVAPGSPAAEAVRIYNVYIIILKRVYFQGLQRDDLIVKFGQLDESSFKSNSLQPLADLVAENEQVSIPSLFLNGQLTTI
jgi:26S proteasome non-ATPase regulatory subunit 9